MAKHIRPTTPPPTRIRVATANASAAPLTGDLLAASAGTAGAADSVTHHKADFDGEGYGDVAFSADKATASEQKNAGDFVALYESANRITSAERTAVSQNTTSVPGSSEAGDGFGRVSAYGDFHHDGFDDLAIGAEHEKVGTGLDGGTVAILQGSTCGLPGGTTIADSAASSHDRWGAALAASDINGDGCPMFGANATN
ncbi:hypothetical protein GTY65_02215 [Streptomyces sp. SID8379]|uniref:FG-GAP repeat protein n=1 Tax=unclassified Streptomyces TaxID=2593676 RepID=UPI00036640A2|nr:MULTISPECIES: FG-GAP repeat protein [unclassified Streptomyces]MYW62898.1 hypothetical protein [Streptomyces sp. SID8379]